MCEVIKSALSKHNTNLENAYKIQNLWFMFHNKIALHFTFMTASSKDTKSCFKLYK